MELLEFQAKELLTRFGVAVPRGRVADSPADAQRIASRLGFARFAVKAQVFAGNRAAAGGVLFAASPEGVRATAEMLLGRSLVTTQTGPKGEPVRWIYIEEAIEALRSLYVSVLLDRDAGEFVLLASEAGGIDLESRAALDPELIVRERLVLARDGAEGDFLGTAERIGLKGAAAAAAARLFADLARLAATLDATLVEVNPLALTADGRLVALDAKLAIDDSALFRHPALAALRAAIQVEEGDPQELAADRHQLNYQKMDGTLGVVVNGAGLALATLDMIVEAGGRPSNFMDIRTTASSIDVAYGFELILANPNVGVVLLNVHGGGMQRCDTIAEGVGIAIRRTGRSLPLVVRLAGNNAEFARTRLQSYGIRFEEGADMHDAVARAVALSRGGRQAA
jgi:succinyl-CoA synthetase beta subunit